MGLIEDLQKVCDSNLLLRNYPMKKHTSLGVGGNAKYFIAVDSLYLLNNLLFIAKKRRIPYKVIGAGSNLLVSDNGYDGLIISTVKLNDVFFKREYVRAMAGATLSKLGKFNLDHNLTGMERLQKIPATVGGAVVMNAGAFGKTISDYIVEVETLSDGKIKRYYKDECKFSYRTSRFKGKKETIVSATFSFENAEREIIEAGNKTYADLREETQPKGKSCGSVFKNPIAQPAGVLIEKAGLKGYAVGGAFVSDKHANFILTNSNVRASDVYKLILHIKEKVNNDFGIILEEEVEYLGDF